MKTFAYIFNHWRPVTTSYNQIYNIIEEKKGLLIKESNIK